MGERGMSALFKLQFDNEEDYRRARDINLAMLEAEGWKPQPDLEMLIAESRIEPLKEKLNEQGVPYRATPDC